MITAAEADGQLLPGGTIVEPTSGNTGVGLAIVAARSGYQCVFVCPDKVASDKIALLRAYGAEVIVCPTSVAPDHPDSYYSVSDRLASEIPGAWKPDQYHNPDNPRAQYETAGPEIWEQTKGRVTHFVAGVGTGGTISGIGRYLKERNPAIQVIGADPEGSVYSGGSGRPYLVEGIGEDFWPTTYDPSVVDRVVAISDADSFGTARPGDPGGGPAPRRIGRDRHRRRARGRTGAPGRRGDRRAHPRFRAGAICRSSTTTGGWPTTGSSGRRVDGRRSAGGPRRRSPALIHTHPDETVRQAIAILREFGVSQLPVVKHEPPVVLAEVVGAVTERDLMDRAFNDAASLDRPVGEVMGPPLPTVGAGRRPDVAVSRLEGAPAVLVLDRGHPIGIVTRSDVLASLAGARGGAGWATVNGPRSTSPGSGSRPGPSTAVAVRRPSTGAVEHAGLSAPRPSGRRRWVAPGL